MTNDTNANVGCLLVGEYVDEAELPANVAFGRGEAVRPQIVGNYLDLWGRDNLKEFIVLLKDGRVIVVRGQGLKHLPGTVPGGTGSYGIVVRAGGEEVLVALFKDFETVGIFHGEVRSDLKIA
jgi:hypothetical protein